MLLRLAYVSMVDSLTTSPIVREVAQKANRANKVAGITGALIYNGRNFMQILEGPPAELRSLMERIRRDRRHYNVQIHYESEVTKRCFAEWGLQLVLPLDHDGPTMPATLDESLQKLWRAFSVLR